MTSTSDYEPLAQQTSPAAVSDVLIRMGFDYQHDMHGVVQQTPGLSIFGQAVTLRSLPTRPDMIEDLRNEAGGDRLRMPFDMAMEATVAGRVLVIDSSGHPDVTVGGGTKFSRLMATGAAGLVTDGSIRDREEVINYGYPVYSHGFSPRSGTTHTLFPHDFNQPITCGGALVRPGDYLIGDETGLVVIPENVAREVLEAAVLKEQFDAFVARKMAEDDAPVGRYLPPEDATIGEFAESIDMSRDDLPFW